MFSDAKSGLTGVVRLLAGQSDYHGYFDVSTNGLARSFSAALPALPLAFLVAGISNGIAAEASLDPDIEATIVSAPHVVTRWALSWAYFPLLAAVLTRMMNRRERFAPWVVVHNWLHLLIVAIQAVPIFLLGLGLTGPGGLLLIGSIVFMAYAFVRVAGAALEVGPALAIGAGSANLLGVLAVNVLTAEIFAG
jgi:hypothetical protein